MWPILLISAILCKKIVQSVHGTGVRCGVRPVKLLDKNPHGSSFSLGCIFADPEGALFWAASALKSVRFLFGVYTLCLRVCVCVCVRALWGLIASSLMGLDKQHFSGPVTAQFIIITEPKLPPLRLEGLGQGLDVFVDVWVVGVSASVCICVEWGYLISLVEVL